MLLRIPRPDDLPPDGVARLPNRLWPFIWFFLKQARSAFIAIALLNGLAHVIDAMVPWFIGRIIDEINMGEPRTIWLRIGGMAAWVGFLYLILSPVLGRTAETIRAQTVPAFTNMIRRQLSMYLQGHSYEYFQSDFAGRLSGKAIETPAAIRNTANTLIGPFLMALVTFTVTFVLFSSTHWVFGAIALIWAGGYSLLLRTYIPRILDASKEASERASVIRGRSVDSLSNVLSVKLFARKSHEDAYLLESLSSMTCAAQRLMHTVNAKFIRLELGVIWIVAASFLASIMLWSKGMITIGEVATIIPLAVRLSQMSWWISEVFSTFYQDLGQVAEGMETITKRHQVTDRSGAQPIAVARGEIRYDNVTFAYGGTSVFEGLSVAIPPGQKVGLVGPSGAGKSTFVNLLLRLYDIQGGRILVDGQDIAVVTQDSLRAHIAVIPQSADLLHRSIRANIAYGRLDATDDEIIEAAKKANAHDFILKLEDSRGRKGYDAFVGERGVKLSGGQRQRIGVARAIVKDAPILILDEATSSLDSESEAAIQKALTPLMENRTVIAVAHRLSTIAHLDRLLVIEDGRIVEDGSHAELLARGGLYARLWAMQSGGFLGDEPGRVERAAE
ncbi:MAG TPA: ABC transporter ATP-binding protein [Alphaproteobacteria bacterium]|nr:ABC transporter ATP-binding protein [Alphaproteobacteria bacterium]